MSTDEARQSSSQAGFTLLEMMVALIMFGVMASIVEHTLGSTQRAERQLSAVRRVTARCEKIAYEVLDEVNRSRKLFQGDTTGQDYLDALDLSRDPILTNARLPLFDEINPMGMDAAGDPRTGNILFFVREGEAVEAVADASSGLRRSIDLHRFVCVYPRETTRVLVSDSQMFPARDLVVWRSALYPSHAQLMAIEDTDERASVVRDLVDRYGCDYAWDANADVDAAFFELGSLGGIGASATTSLVIEEDVDASDRGRLVYADVQLARTAPTDFHRRSRFTADDVSTWVPDGFEVKIVGISGARKVWFRVTAESPATRHVVGVLGCEMTASPRDM